MGTCFPYGPNFNGNYQECTPVSAAGVGNSAPLEGWLRIWQQLKKVFRSGGESGKVSKIRTDLLPVP